MYKYLFIAVVLTTACSSRDEQFCECLEAGEALNIETQQFFDKAPTEEDSKRIDDLKKKKNDACANYTEMGGEEMREKKKQCEE